MGERSNKPFNLRSVARSLSLKSKNTGSNSTTKSSGTSNPKHLSLNLQRSNSGRNSRASNGSETENGQKSALRSPPIESSSLPTPGYTLLDEPGPSNLDYASPNGNAGIYATLRKSQSTRHRKAQKSFDVLGFKNNKRSSAISIGDGRRLRASKSEESLVPEPMSSPSAAMSKSPPKLQSTARGAPLGPPPYGARMPMTSPYVVTSPTLRATKPLEGESRDWMQNVKDHMRANADLFGSGPFYSVQRGWKKGIYASKDEADRQIKNFPGPIMKVFENVDEAIAFLDAKTAEARPSNEEQDEETLERARIFSASVSPEAEGLRRAISLSAERKEARRRSKEARPKTALEAEGLVRSPAPNGQAEAADISSGPLELQARKSPLLRAATLLPVRSLVSAISFYQEVLGFSCASQSQGGQAIMLLDSAAVCLRASDMSPSLPPGNGWLGSMSRSASNHGRSQSARLQLPSMVLDKEAKTAPEDEQKSDSPSRRIPKSPRSPVPPPPPPPRSAGLSLSGISVIIEYADSLALLKTALEQKIEIWTKASRLMGDNKFGMRRFEGPKVLTEVEDKLWGTQELHVSDPDGHRLIFSTPFITSPFNLDG